MATIHNSTDKAIRVATLAGNSMTVAPGEERSIPDSLLRSAIAAGLNEGRAEPQKSSRKSTATKTTG